jgi:hypothetical protein
MAQIENFIRKHSTPSDTPKGILLPGIFMKHFKSCPEYKQKSNEDNKWCVIDTCFPCNCNNIQYGSIVLKNATSHLFKYGYKEEKDAISLLRYIGLCLEGELSFNG